MGSFGDTRPHDELGRTKSPNLCHLRDSETVPTTLSSFRRRSRNRLPPPRGETSCDFGPILVKRKHSQGQTSPEVPRRSAREGRACAIAYNSPCSLDRTSHGWVVESVSERVCLVACYLPHSWACTWRGSHVSRWGADAALATTETCRGHGGSLGSVSCACAAVRFRVQAPPPAHSDTVVFFPDTGNCAVCVFKGSTHRNGRRVTAR